MKHIKIEKVYWSLGVGLIISAIFVLSLFNYFSKTVQGESDPQIKCYLGGKTASTSITVLTTSDTASTTLICNTQGAESLDFQMALTASSSVTQLNWLTEFANATSTAINCISSPGLCDWFGEDGYTANSNTLVTHGGTTVEHRWNANSTVASTTRKNITVDALNTRFVRITLGVTGSNGLLWIQGVGDYEL